MSMLWLWLLCVAICLFHPRLRLADQLKVGALNAASTSAPTSLIL